MRKVTEASALNACPMFTGSRGLYDYCFSCTVMDTSFDNTVSPFLLVLLSLLYCTSKVAFYEKFHVEPKLKENSETIITG